MRLVEKKCPNCGGGLKFSFEDKETTCEFCGRSFEIERDEKISEDKDEMFNADNYALTEEAKKAATAVVGTMAAMQIVPFIIFGFAVVSIICFGIFSAKRFDNKTSRTETKQEEVNPKQEMEELQEEAKKTQKEILEEQGYIFEFDKLTEAQINDIHDNTLTILNAKLEWYGSILRSHGKWSYAGMYLLTNDLYGNYLYDVYKISFKGKDYYAAVEYADVKVVDSKLVVNMDGRIQGSLNSGSKARDDTFGYESAKDFFNKVIRGKISEYSVLTSGDVYNE